MGNFLKVVVGIMAVNSLYNLTSRLNELFSQTSDVFLLIKDLSIQSWSLSLI